MSSNVLTSWRYTFERFNFLTINSNDFSQNLFCIRDASLLITGIWSILKPDVMATKGYSFQDDENIIIDIDMESGVSFRRWKVTNFFPI